MTESQLIAQILLDVPDAPRPTVREQIQRMARELCQEADAWVHKGIVVVAATSDYPQLLSPENAEVRRIRCLNDGDRPLRRDVDFSQPTRGTITLHRTPDNDTLTGDLACSPLLDTPVPQILLDDWADTIGYGARWRLLLMPQPWRDPQMATYYQTQFQAGVSDAKAKAAAGHARGGSRVRHRPFF